MLQVIYEVLSKYRLYIKIPLFYVTEKLNTEPETIHNCVSALAFLLIECFTGKITEKDFQYLRTLKFSEDQVSILWDFVSNNLTSLQLKHSSSDLRFRSLEWRLEAKVATRSLNTQSVPKIKIKLYLDSETSFEHREKILGDEQSDHTTRKEILLETTPSSLSHIIKVLEQAQIEARTYRTRNFVKAFQ